MNRFLLMAAGIALSMQVSAQWMTTTNTVSKTTMYTQGRIFGGGSLGVYISDDDGATWTSSNNGLYNLNANVKVIIGDTVYLESPENVWKSHYSNINWMTTSNGLPGGGEILSFLYNGANTMYVTYQSGKVYTSSNNGNSWTLKGNVGSYVVSIQEFDNALFACTNGAGIFKSTDGGATWNAYNAGIASGSMVIFAFTTYNNELYAGTYSGKIYKLTAGGTNWAEVYSHAAVRDLYTLGNTLMAATDDGFVYTQNGSTWNVENAGLSGTGLYAFSLGASNQSLFLGGFYGGVQKRALSDLGITTSVTSHKKATEVVIYPNPVSNQLYVVTEETGSTYTVTDITGRNVQKGMLTLGKNVIDVQPLSTGMYLLHIVGKDGHVTSKFNKQ